MHGIPLQSLRARGFPRRHLQLAAPAYMGYNNNTILPANATTKLMPRIPPPLASPPLSSLFAAVDLTRMMKEIDAVYAVPWYLPVPERSVVRVFDGTRLSRMDRNPSAFGALQVDKVAEVLTAVIGRPPVRGVSDGEVVELQVPAPLFAAAATALRMEYRCLALESDFILKLVRCRRTQT